jgi:hypothetical protein
MQDKNKFFDEHGYVVIDDAFTKDEVKAFVCTLHDIIFYYLNKYKIVLPGIDELSIEVRCDNGLLALRSSNPKYPLLVQAAISRSGEYYRLSSSPVVLGQMRSLLNLSQSSPFYFTNNGIIFTNPNDEDNKQSSNINTEWHKDTFYTIPKSQFLHIWAPILHPSNKDIGTLMVCPGSHHGGVGQQRINITAQYDHRYYMSPDEIDSYVPCSISLELGQALIFDSRLIHKSGSNISDHVRCTLIGLYHNVLNENFQPLLVQYLYSEQTPEGYFYEIFQDKKALDLIDEQSFN